jgi:hypothetical protein
MVSNTETTMERSQKEVKTKTEIEANSAVNIVETVKVVNMDNVANAVATEDLDYNMVLTIL